MDPPLINGPALLSSAYALAEIWAADNNLGHFDASHSHSTLRDGSADESTVTDHSGAKRKKDATTSEDLVSTTTTTSNDLNDSGNKRMKLGGVCTVENDGLKAEAEASSAVASNKSAEQSTKPCEPHKQDYIHVRARRGQATDSHSLAERARREKISERMKILQDLIPGCNKVIGKALVLDEIINYVQSLQHQVEFLSMKLEAVNSRVNMNPTIEGFPSKDVRTQPYDIAGVMLGSQASREFAQGSHPGWLHMQIGGGFEKPT